MYKNVYEDCFKITINMVDDNDYLKLSSILDIAQDVASDHADYLNIGFNEFIKDNLIWVLVRNKVEIIKNVKCLKRVRAVTYPLKPRFVEYPREVLIYDKDELIIKISQVWCIYNIKDKKVINYQFNDYESDHPSEFLDRCKKIRSNDELTYLTNVKALYTYCDHNKHLNNTHYLDWYLDYVYSKSKIDVKSFHIEYLKQVYLDEEVQLFAKINQKNHQLEGRIGNNKIFYLEVN